MSDETIKKNYVKDDFRFTAFAKYKIETDEEYSSTSSRDG